MILTSANRSSSLRAMPILDDDVVRMCPRVILLGEIIEVQKGLDWVNFSSEKQYQTSSSAMTWLV